MKRNSQNGFTLLELMVVITIMIIIFSISIANYDKMGKRIELENSAYNMALTIREAQSYGINKRARTIGIPDFGENYRYGVYFDITGTVDKVSNTKFIIYLDGYHGTEDGQFTSVGSFNCTGDGENGDECYSQVLLTRGTHITDIYLYGDSGWEAVSQADISFVRPNPDAIIIETNQAEPKSRVRIVLGDRGENAYYCVEIGTAGDMSIKGGSSNCILP